MMHTGELLIDDDTSPDLFMGRATGLVARDYKIQPMKAVNFPLIPRSEWSARIKEMVDTKSRLSDLRATADNGRPFPSLNQGPVGYCWSHSATHAVMYTRARMGLPYVPLSAYAVAATIKNGRDEGGWGALAAEFIQERGVPSQEKWPQGSRNLSNGTAECWADAAKHKITGGWFDLDAPVYNRDLSFDQMMTLLLSRVPVIVDFNWWGHSVCAVDPVEVEPGSFGIRIQNSWGDEWTEGSTFPGTGILRGSKANPDGATAPTVVTAA